MAMQSIEIENCKKCPRLRKHCLETAKVKRKSYLGDTYWGLPVSGFGVAHAQLVLIGLAPAAHGANRTGRMFTGDRSGDWLYRALHKAGFANQATSVSKNDGLKLINAYVTATVKCAPPDNKPTPAEIAHCVQFLDLELKQLTKARVYLALGKLAFDQTWKKLKELDFAEGARPEFKHLSLHRLKKNSDQWILASYHPSQQNTFTGKLTEPMFDAVFERAKQILRENALDADSINI